MSDVTVTLDFTVRYPTEGNLDYIRVGCVGVGSSGDRWFKRHDFATGYYEHNPYSLVAKQWFIDHPEPKVWKVGDTVPAGTIVGRKWASFPTAEGNGFPQVFSSSNATVVDRVILWVEP